MQDQWQPRDNVWFIPWKMQVPERIRCFLWLSLRDSLLTNAICHSRHLTDDPSCPVCGVHEGSALQVLRDCQNTKTLWTSIIMKCTVKNFFELPLQDWLLANLRAACLFQGTNIAWNKLFLSLVWQIWKRRNAFIFKGWVALNSDVVFSSSSSLGSAGGLIRDDAGNWEREIQCQIDSSDVFSMISSSNARSSSSALIQAIASLQDRAWFVNFKLIHREANSVADCLAKFSLCQDTNCTFLGPVPSFLHSFLQLNANGAARDIL
ncbi:hypothetical protein F3Y22_tig00002237pilonHSYRG00161 [Hibiscus syriacus]|uniref:Reverse transcriptase zinc-binding domain-containing protein n=1 Tax=Hibiscus syriacus TaxID=106335 RepID=A0A6A3CXJ4_HIBSY|nr:hypothetical protein F3Y22_tig00002237pilonHSYRG00161 [Hibiscus syriacus]